MSLDHEQLATAAFIEHHILVNANQEGLLDNVSLRTLESFGVSDQLIAPFLQVRVLTLAYCLLVYPSEIWKRRGRLDEVIQYALGDESFPLTARAWFDAKSLRHIRNAVAHARVEFGDGYVEFEDVNNQGRQRFKKRLTFDDSILLLLVIGRAFHENLSPPEPLH